MRVLRATHTKRKRWGEVKSFLYTIISCFILPLVIIGGIVYGILYLIQLFCKTIIIYLDKGMIWIDENITSNL